MDGSFEGAQVDAFKLIKAIATSAPDGISTHVNLSTSMHDMQIPLLGHISTCVNWMRKTSAASKASNALPVGNGKQRVQALGDGKIVQTTTLLNGGRCREYQFRVADRWCSMV
mmetsp:Transcript_1979/g.3752  ORF Transcript_1979/g.3752 Transcript_1979/m.3752 type:complete len:113 (+) Transcript_1979:446-784(+)|eukprot:CAMPEP_0201976526 /NCGR_PEP_ID=MMETSP0904-20121228/57561_1 /ASSEMBLY_ACC=CAM_ASM_000553 /TAXON_ID=420261 /ORGANISM="Thalassiosira antarctica, Strain CCMP982" /LENGTH=112 /DNA_ID=CAMNT_0048527639 /DNA_START=438 /DNA_END=776 /DNA_ORIENTATION=-